MAVSEITTPFFFPQLIRRKSKPVSERKHISEVRAQLYERSAGLCELNLSPKYWKRITWLTMHACHIVSRARGGKWELNNLLAGCAECHIGWEHNGGKPCPAK